MPWATIEDDAILRAQSTLAQALQYARDRGINACLGFELHGDPTDLELRRHAEARIRHMLTTYPMLEYVWFWQQEGRGAGSAPPAPDSALDLIIQRHRPTFEYLGSDQRIAEASRVAAWMDFANSVVKRLRPGTQVIVSGWGGDRWMRFSDFYIGLDSILPEDVIFAALDNIDPAWEPNVSAAYGQLSPERNRWPIPWFESDGGGARRDQWAPQANVRPFTALVRDAKAKNCDGLLGIHWQTRGIEEVAAYTAQYAWNPDLTYEEFYRDFAAKAFGDEAFAETLIRLESLGPRWTGSLGQVECGKFAWFSSPDRPREENLAALREIRDSLDGLNPRHWSQWDRVDYLRATIDFLLAFDEAALVLQPGGEIDVMLVEAETLKQAGDPAARTLARVALKAMRDCPLEQALRAYAPRLTTQGDFGNLATLNVKAFAAYEALWKRAEAVLEEPQFRKAPQPYGELVVKHPPTAIPEGTPFTIEVISPLDSSAVGARMPSSASSVDVRSIHLTHRPLGSPDAAKVVPMHHVDGRLWRYKIPAEEIGPEGLEFRVADSWPSISPGSYSITTMPSSGPKLYGPHLHRDMALVPWTGDADQPAVLRCTVIPAEPYSPAKVQLMVDGESVSAHARYTTALFPLSPEWLAKPLLLCAAIGVDRQGRAAQSLTGLTAPDPPQSATDVQAEIVGPFHARVTWQAIPCAHYEVFRPTGAPSPSASAVGARMPSSAPAVGARTPSSASAVGARTPSSAPAVGARTPSSASAVGARTPSSASAVGARMPSSASLLSPDTLLAEWAWTTYDDATLPPNSTHHYAVVAVDDLGRHGQPSFSDPLTVEDFPLAPAPEGLTATPGLGRVTLTWNPVAEGVRGYAISIEAAGEWSRASGDDPLAATQFVVGGLDPAIEYGFRVQAVDRAGRLGDESAVVSASPLPVPRGPVFSASFSSTDADTGQPGTLHGKARLDSGALDVAEGGWIAYPGEELLQAAGPLTAELWVKLDRPGRIPVMLSFGHWEAPGYWLQFIGGKVRWYLPVQKVLDGGSLTIGEWSHICATYDGLWSRLHVDGSEVSAREIGPIDNAPWTGELRVGIYSDLDEQFQTCGLIDDVRIYQRALSAEEIESRFAEGRSE